MSKALYLFNKYSPIVDQALDQVTIFQTTTSLQLCLSHYKVISSFYFIGTICSEAILLARTIALWGWNKYVLALLAGGASAIGMVCVYAVYQSNLYVEFPAVNALRLIECVPSNLDAWPALACMVLGDTAIIVLTFVLWYRERRAVPSAAIGTLFPTIYRDCALAYLFIGTISVANLLVLMLAEPEFSSAMEMPLRVVHSTLVTRVLLNLRGSASKTSGDTSYREQTRVTTIGWELATSGMPQDHSSLRNVEDFGNTI
ncbi:hypothetical protein BD311DRAFT_665561 [Dichomitus squalens]|uniref:Uncharacterized protein n=1 Tax=Dichomitus squalens TaxID=114155 RepID=A0A4Q9MM56_9APHY|nr:hypothetical protein BD311DRAFT_665561 [Dichomitus squalens]